MPAAATEHRALRDPDVVLDVELDRGLLFLVLENLGDLPAHTVRVRFEQPLRGLRGSAGSTGFSSSGGSNSSGRGGESASSSTARLSSSHVEIRPSSQ